MLDSIVVQRFTSGVALANLVLALGTVLSTDVSPIEHTVVADQVTTESSVSTSGSAAILMNSGPHWCVMTGSMMSLSGETDMTCKV